MLQNLWIVFYEIIVNFLKANNLKKGRWLGSYKYTRVVKNPCFL